MENITKQYQVLKYQVSSYINPFFKNYIQEIDNISKKLCNVIRFIFSAQRLSFKAILFQFAVDNIPYAKNKLENDLKKLEQDFMDSFDKATDKKQPKLQLKGMKPGSLQKRKEEWVDRDEKISNTGKVSGSRYCWDDEYERELKDFAKEFFYHNPLHYDIFPATRQMEAELITMTCSMFGTSHDFGIVTSGGTESILMGVMAHRNYGLKYKGIKKPNLVMPLSAHTAFIKACKYFDIECIRVPVNEDGSVDMKLLKKKINKNTIMIVGSVPSFPHGIVDPISEMAKIAKQNNIGLHVDCCLGGFVAAFAKDISLNLPAFDFTVEGVTSISCDHHKYGLAPKGVSVCMFKTKELRHCCYTSVSDWPGGFYTTPSVSGSKAGAPIAGAWYAMQYHGREGYIELAKNISQTVTGIVNFIRKTPELRELDVIGNPNVCAFAIIYKKGINKNIYHLEGAMSKKGWHLAGIQLPPAIHVSVTHGIVANFKQFCNDLKQAVQEVAQNPEQFKDSSSASMYGASVKVPNSNVLDRILNVVVDCFLKL